jgi:methionyl-tRNA formyltransferase
MRIVIAGTGRLGASLLRALLSSSHEVVAIVQDGRKTVGAQRWVNPARFLGGRHSLAGVAARRGLPTIWIDQMTEEELAPLRRLAPDVLLVGGFGIILKRPLLDLPRVGCVNTHSSLLPRHRGPNPFCAVILAGEKESGVTFHVMEEGIDTGDILDQTTFPVDEDATAYDVYTDACDIAGERVVAVMNRIAREGLHGTRQDPALATYDKKPTLADAWIDWTRLAVEIDRMVRAMSPTPMPRFMHGNTVVYVARTRVDPRPVEAAPGTVLLNRTMPIIATGCGKIRLHVAFARRPFPWLWPAPWTRLAEGERLPIPAPGAPDGI